MIQDIKDDIDHKELAKKNMKTEISALDIQKSKAEKQLHDERTILELLQKDLADQEAIVNGFEQEQLEKEQLKRTKRITATPTPLTAVMMKKMMKKTHCLVQQCCLHV